MPPTENANDKKREDIAQLREDLAASKAEYQGVLDGQVREVDSSQLDAEKARLAAELKESQALVARQKDANEKKAPAKATTKSGEGS
jgi:hypothetical protein